MGFVDDDPSKLKIRLQGIPVLGRVSDLPAWLPLQRAQCDHRDAIGIVGENPGDCPGLQAMPRRVENPAEICGQAQGDLGLAAGEGVKVEDF